MLRLIDPIQTKYTDPAQAQILKSQQTQLSKLLAGKQLREWSTEDVILWLSITNDGLFAKYIDIFTNKQIDGHKLMSLDDEKSAIDLLGTTHQINTFIQCIKQLKSKNGRKMSMSRRRASRRGHSLFDGSAQSRANLFATPSIPRSSTPTSRSRANTTKRRNGRNSKRKYRSRATSSLASPKHGASKSTTSVFSYETDGKRSRPEIKIITTNTNGIGNSHKALTPTFSQSHSSINININKRSKHQQAQTLSDINFHGHNNNSVTFTDLLSQSPTASQSELSPKLTVDYKRQRSLSQGDAQDPTDKKQLWNLYKPRETYSAILFKRGKFNKSFKKRWLVLCETSLIPRVNRLGNKKPVHMHSQSVSFGLENYESKENNEESISSMPTNPQLNISNYSLDALNENGKKLKNRNKSNNRLNVKKRANMGHFNSFDNVNANEHANVNRAYLFYFNERPIKDNDYPNGYINLSSVQCVIGLLENDDDDQDDTKQNHNSSSSKQKVKYLKKKNKGKESEYYEIILKTNDREWIFGCLDSKSYVEWLMRLKKFEQK